MSAKSGAASGSNRPAHGGSAAARGSAECCPSIDRRGETADRRRATGFDTRGIETCAGLQPTVYGVHTTVYRPGRPVEGGQTTHMYIARRIVPYTLSMVRKKKLSPSGAKDENGEYHNVHVNLHEDELAVAGMDIGDEVFVRVRDGKIIIQKADTDAVEHDL